MTMNPGRDPLQLLEGLHHSLSPKTYEFLEAFRDKIDRLNEQEEISPAEAIVMLQEQIKELAKVVGSIEASLTVVAQSGRQD